VRPPDFFVLGGAKCGTTSLYHTLGQHPDLLFSEPKEPTFFEAEFERGLEYYWRRYFPHWKGEKTVGDARVYHLYLPFVASRIRELAPRARLIAILRHPVERAHSLWWHRHALDLEPRSFETALDENRRRLESGETFEGEAGARAWKSALYRNTNGTRIGTYLDGGYYAEQLQRYLSLFPAEQLKVVFFEDLSRDPEAVSGAVLRFLDLEPPERLDITPQNPARTQRRSRSARLLRQLAESSRLGSWVPAPLRRRLRSAMRGSAIERPPLDPATRRELIEHYRAPNRRLQDLLGRDLSGWNE
jgi:hypothetical protein